MKKSGLIAILVIIIAGILLVYMGLGKISRNRVSALNTCRGAVQEMLRAWGPAEARYRSALKADPRNVEAIRGLARVCLGKKKYDSAILFVNKSLSLDRRWSKGYLVRAKAYEGIQNIPAAVSSYRKYLDETPSLSSATRRIFEEKIEKLSAGMQI